MSTSLLPQIQVPKQIQKKKNREPSWDNRVKRSSFPINILCVKNKRSFIIEFKVIVPMPLSQSLYRLIVDAYAMSFYP